MAQGSTADWDEESIARLFRSVDEPCRALLSAVAAAVLDGRHLAVNEAAAQVEMGQRETLALLRELNEVAREDSRPVLIARRAASDRGAHDARLLDMDAEVARLVHAADRAHLLAEEHPLGPDHA